jgi:hypothetical protein
MSADDTPRCRPPSADLPPALADIGINSPLRRHTDQDRALEALVVKPEPADRMRGQLGPAIESARASEAPRADIDAVLDSQTGGVQTGGVPQAVTDHAGRPTACRPGGTRTPPSRASRPVTAVSAVGSHVLLVGAESRTWRRELGALAWAVLEELAICAHLDGQGWVAPTGVRDVAVAIGVTKDTAARAVAALGAAGLLTRQRVQGPDGRQRSGYRLNLPEGIELRDRPTDQDTPTIRSEISHRPDNQDSRKRPTDVDSPTSMDSPPNATIPTSQSTSSLPARRQPQATRPTTSAESEAQGTLFDTTPGVTHDRAVHESHQALRASGSLADGLGVDDG